MNTREIKEVEIQIDAAKDMIATAAALSRLMKNRDFKKVILEGYFKDEAARLVMARGNIQMSEAQRDNLLRMADAIGGLAAYLELLFQRGDQAEEALRDAEEAHTDMLQEEDIK